MKNDTLLISKIYKIGLTKILHIIKLSLTIGIFDTLNKVSLNLNA